MKIYLCSMKEGSTSNDDEGGSASGLRDKRAPVFDGVYIPSLRALSSRTEARESTRDKRKLVFDGVYVPTLRALSNGSKAHQSTPTISARFRRNLGRESVPLASVESSGDEGSLYETATDCGSSETSETSLSCRTRTSARRTDGRQGAVIHRKSVHDGENRRGGRKVFVEEGIDVFPGQRTAQERFDQDHLDESDSDGHGDESDNEHEGLEEEDGGGSGGFDKEDLAFLFDDEVDAELDNIDIPEALPQTPSLSDHNTIPHTHTTSKKNASFSSHHEGNAVEDGRDSGDNDIDRISDFEDNDVLTDREQILSEPR
jgi:hypothetical protein